MAGTRTSKGKTSDPLQALVTSHEARIQHLEQQLPELSSQVTAVESQVRHTGEMLGDKLDNLATMMDNHVTETRERTGKILARVDALEGAKKVDVIKRAVWRDVLKKFSIPITLAGGAAAAKLGEFLFEKFTG
jgi:hypothetical protein